MIGVHTSVRQLPDTPSDPPDRWVARFGLTERFAHWWTVLMVATALISGAALGGEAESGPTLTLHLASVIAIGAGLLAAVVFGDTRALLLPPASSPGRPAAKAARTAQRSSCAWCC